jgi:hypothetical protein
MTKGCWRPNKRWIDPDRLALPAPDVSATIPANEGTCGNPVVGSSPAPQKSRQAQSQKALPAPEMKAAAPQRAPADVRKVSKGQESQEAKASHPMASRTRSASRAGGLRPRGGPGQTDTCVVLYNPSKT